MLKTEICGLEVSEIENLFPIKTKADLTKVSKKCEEDLQFSKKKVKYFKKLLGNGTSTNLVQILRNIINPDLLIQYNWRGIYGKKTI